MSDIQPLIPGQMMPELSLQLAGGGQFSLADESPENFTLLVLYRGLHCPICSRYLGDLSKRVEEFEKRGVSIIVGSSDTQERAEQAKTEWKLDNLRIAYGLDLPKARELGLYISKGIGKTSSGFEEPALFSEPGLFLIRPNGELFFVTVQSMPFARPSFAELLPALDFVIARNYPGRGEVVTL